MRDEIARLTASDFAEALDVKHLSFGKQPPGFTALLPLLYRSLNAGYEYAVKRHGRICALVGVIPMTWQVGNTQLRVAGIAGVSTLPEYRGLGLMSQLMRHCVEAIRNDGFHLSWLGGQRQRYGYFGYERCGLSYTHRLSTANLKHALPENPALSVRSLREADQGDIEFAKALHDLQTQWVRHTASDFYLRSLGWHNRLHLVTEEGGPIGYLISTPEATELVELRAVDHARILELARAWIEQTAKREEGAVDNVAVSVIPSDIELSRLLGRVSEGASISTSGNWQVFDWPRALDALMRVRHGMGPMAPGEVALCIDGVGTLRLFADTDGAGCQVTDGSSSSGFNPLQTMRMLFGPLPPSAVAPLAPGLTELESWCPLPLSWARQDAV